MQSSCDKGRTFSLDLSSDGAASLQRAVLNKLSEFMGNYTDDVLAQYVVVLVGHGKQRAQAVKDLEAFLGDQSEAFVSWLWDHLYSNMQLYALVPKTITKVSGGGATRQPLEERSKEVVSKSTCANGQVSLAHNRKEEKLRKTSSKGIKVNPVSCSSRQERMVCMEPEGLMVTEEQDPGCILAHSERALSPKHMRATRRLLQSAVREAVTLPPGYSRSSKRLRSVVQSAIENAECLLEASEHQYFKDEERTDMARQDKSAMPAIPAKETLSACDDVISGGERHGGCVWDRLGRKPSYRMANKDGGLHGFVVDACEVSEVEESGFNDNNVHCLKQTGSWNRATSTSTVRLRKCPMEDGVMAVVDMMKNNSAKQSIVAKRANNYGTYGNNGEGLAMPFDHDVDQRVRPTGQEESVTVQCRMDQVDGTNKAVGSKAMSVSPEVLNSSQKVFNIHVNVNTWKRSSRQMPENVPATEHSAFATALHHSLQRQTEKDAAAGIASGGKEPEENVGSKEGISELKKRMHEVQFEMAKLRARQLEATSELKKLVSSNVSSAQQAKTNSDDGQAQTVLVTNIHFGATKESVAAHFERCGDIKRILMLTDGATGQHKGCAYVEFNTKDAANKAIALTGSFFYSRTLQVVKKDGSTQDMQENLTNQSLSPSPQAPLRKKWLRGSSQPLYRSPAMPRPNTNGSTSLQWKRDSAVPGGTANPVQLNKSKPIYSLQVCPGRSLSYVRCPINPLKEAGRADEQATCWEGENVINDKTNAKQGNENIKAIEA